MRNDKCQECGNPIDAFSLFFHPNTYLHDHCYRISLSRLRDALVPNQLTLFERKAA
jgi:hypothetical protein